MKRQLNFLYIDIMFPLWSRYHKWILHRGKFGFWDTCDHFNPYDILTPRRLDKQIKYFKEKL